MRCRSWVCALLVVGLTTPMLAALAQRPDLRVERPAVAAALQSQFRQFLAAKGVGAAEQAKDLAALAALPEALRDLVVTRAVEAMRSPVVAREWERIDPGRIVITQPRITGFSPPSAGADDFVVVLGQNFAPDSKVVFGGVEQQTWHWSLFGQTLTTMVGFRLPATATNKGGTTPVAIKNPTVTGPTVAMPIVAPRGYRGLHGWQFANAGHPTIPWAVFRNYFGASNVEFADGTPRPSAQSWYNSSYKGVGGGGNCYGMSLTSLRKKHGNMAGLLHEAWWAANPRTFVWDYTSNRNNDQVWQTIQEMQGSQLAEPQHTILWSRIGAQNPNGSWLSAQTITAQAAPHGCVMAITGAGGHATVPYRTGPDGPTRQIIHYDNNTPYSTMESGGPDRSIANVNRSANTFSYGGYNKVAIFDLPELLVAPSLPSGVGASMGAAAQSAYLVVQKPARVTQITDERGNTFYVGNQENTGANRIPGAFYTPPIMGGPVPDSYPHTWLFTNASGKTLTFEVAGAPQGTEVHFIQKGVVTTMTARGASLRFSATGVNTPAHRLSIANPGAARIEQLRVIAAPNQSEERTFEIRNIGADLDQALEIGLSADRSELQILNRSGRAAALQVTLRADAANSHSTTRALAVNLAANQAGGLKPAAWRALNTQTLDLELRTLQGVRTGAQQLRP